MTRSQPYPRRSGDGVSVYLDAEESFALLLRYSGTVDNPPAWLCTVARRMVGHAHRQQRRVAGGNAGEHLDRDGVRWHSQSLQTSLQVLTEARILMDEVAGLPDRQRVATYLRHVQGWSLPEIAAYLDCAPATAGVHVHRGAARIKASRSVHVGGPTSSPSRSRRWPAALSAFVVVATAVDLALQWLGSGFRTIGSGTLRLARGFEEFFCDNNLPCQDASPAASPWFSSYTTAALAAGLILLIWLAAWLTRDRRLTANRRGGSRRSGGRAAPATKWRILQRVASGAATGESQYGSPWRSTTHAAGPSR